MKRFLFICSLFFFTSACAVQSPTPDVAVIVSATLTAVATQQQGFPQAGQPEATQALLTKAPAARMDTPWKTYTSSQYGFAFDYPSEYDNAAYKDSCGIKETNAGIHLGHQIDLLVLGSDSSDMAAAANNILQGRGWSNTSMQKVSINGLDALTVEYRFGGTNRFGTFTLINLNGLILAINFSAGDFCELPAGQIAEPDVYSHVLATFHAVQAEANSTPQPVDTSILPTGPSGPGQSSSVQIQAVEMQQGSQSCAPTSSYIITTRFTGNASTDVTYSVNSGDNGSLFYDQSSAGDYAGINLDNNGEASAVIGLQGPFSDPGNVQVTVSVLENGQEVSKAQVIICLSGEYQLNK